MTLINVILEAVMAELINLDSVSGSCEFTSRLNVYLKKNVCLSFNQTRNILTDGTKCKEMSIVLLLSLYLFFILLNLYFENLSFIYVNSKVKCTKK